MAEREDEETLTGTNRQQRRTMSEVRTTHLREQKLPKYNDGIGWKDFEIKYLMAAGTRGRTKEALEGKFMDLSETISDDEQEERELENKRAFADLIASVPGGELTRLVYESKTSQYPEGCAGTAWKNLIQKIGKSSWDDRRRLKEVFESEAELGKQVNPAEYIDKLKEVRAELKSKYDYEKTDEDIIDQVIKVVNNNYQFIIEQIKSDRRRNHEINLEEVRDNFNETYLDI